MCYIRRVCYKAGRRIRSFPLIKLLLSSENESALIHRPTGLLRHLQTCKCQQLFRHHSPPAASTTCHLWGIRRRQLCVVFHLNQYYNKFKRLEITALCWDLRKWTLDPSRSRERKQERKKQAGKYIFICICYTKIAYAK